MAYSQQVFSLTHMFAGKHVPSPGTVPTVEELANYQWDKYEDAEKALFAACEAQGFGISKANSENKSTCEMAFYRRHVFSCWKSKAKPVSGSKLAAAAAVPPEKKRKRESSKGTCEWQGCITYSTRDHLWRFIHPKNRNVHDHEMTDDPAAIPANKRRAKEDLNLDAEVETFAVHPKATAGTIADEIRNRHPQTRINRHDVLNIMKKFREERPGGEGDPGQQLAAQQQQVNGPHFTSQSPNGQQVNGQQFTGQPVAVPQLMNLSDTKPGFWYRIFSKMPAESRIMIWEEWLLQNNIANNTISSSADASGSPNVVTR